MGNKPVLNFKLIVLLVIAGLLFSGCSKPKNLIAALDALDVSMNLNKQYKIKDYNNIKEKTMEVKEIFAISDEDVLKIKTVHGLSEEKAIMYITTQRDLIDYLFSKQNVPYPGPLTNNLECPEEYFPKIEEEQDKDSWRVFYYLYANDRLTFGGCSEDILSYNVAVAFVQCKEKSEIYQIEYFTPKANPTFNYKEVVKSFKCKK